MSDFQITANSGRQWATGHFKQIQGRRGLGFFRLTFVVDLNIDPSDAALGDRLIGLVADIVVGGQPAGRAMPVPNQLPILPSNYSFERQLNLELDMERAQVEAIENIRNGTDLTFNV